MKDKIIEILKNSKEPKTANAIARDIGYSKATPKLREEIEKLVEKGNILEGSNGKHTTYAFNEDMTLADGVQTEIENVIPEVSKQVINGYEIHKGRDAVTVVVPDGSKIKMNKDQFLTVINDRPEYVGKTLEDAFNIIKSYTIENDIRSFVVEDICQSKKIGTKDDIKVPSNHIMFLTIKKHNKAA